MSTNNGLQGSAKVLTAQQRDIEALRDRTADPDMSWQRIANKYGYASRGAACKAVLDLHRRNQKEASNDFREKWDAEFDVALDEVKDILIGTYGDEQAQEDIEDMEMDSVPVSDILKAVHQRMRTDYKLRLDAVTALARINERVAKMHGYDAPAKVEATGAAGFPIMVNPALLPDRAVEALQEDAARAAEDA